MTPQTKGIQYRDSICNKRTVAPEETKQEIS